MARITPKTNWVGADVPSATDFNRIESNTKQAFTELDAEAAARIAGDSAEAAARIAADNSEAAARIAGDNALNAYIQLVEGKLLKIKTVDISFTGTGSQTVNVVFTSLGFTPSAIIWFGLKSASAGSAPVETGYTTYSFSSGQVSLTAVNSIGTVNGARITVAGN
ncbi:MAG: hypothetical protein C0436_00090 [Alphaproteobacteria bacterium]|nr:hypothetical protein [Alphaproteobacteria bacterium]